MSVRSEIVSQIKNDWEGTLLESICLKLLDYIVKRSGMPSLFLTYGTLHRVIGIQHSSEDLALAIDYFCNKSIDLLSSNLEYIDDENNTYPVEEDEDDGNLINCETGEIITDTSNVFSYFTLTDKAKSLS